LGPVPKGGGGGSYVKNFPQQLRTALPTCVCDGSAHKQTLQVFLSLCRAFCSLSLSVLNCNFSKEQSMIPDDDGMIETCRSVLSVLM